LVLSGKFWDYTSLLSQDHFLPHPLPFIIHYHPDFRSYVGSEGLAAGTIKNTVFRVVTLVVWKESMFRRNISPRSSESKCKSLKK
jgi:hypothetical protein